MRHIVSGKKFPIRSLQSSVQLAEEAGELLCPTSMLGYNDSKNDDDGVIQVKKILRMLEESNERPAAYHLYNKPVRLNEKTYNRR